MLDLDSWVIKIEGRLIEINEDRRQTESWVFKEFLREISESDLTEDRDLIKLYKLQNKRWKILSKMFPTILHQDSFANNVKTNIGVDVYSWKNLWI